ncbi:MAG: hypothetical protein U0414_13265 [Polyangiaceae bacterium]
MKDPKKTKRRILTAGAGVVAFTAFEGLACGNPVAPAYEVPRDNPPADATAVPSATATGSATTTSSGTTGAAPASTLNVTVTSQLDTREK